MTQKMEDLQKDIANMEKELAEAKKTLREMKTKGLREAWSEKASQNSIDDDMSNAVSDIIDAEDNFIEVENA